MEIFVPKIPFVTGFVQAWTFHNEDVLQREPKQYIECDNEIEDFLLESIMTHMQSSSGNTGYELDTSGWATNKYPGDTNSSTTSGDTDNNLKDGIIIQVDDTTGWVKKNAPAEGHNLIKDFALTDNITAQAGGSSNIAVWSAQAEWGTGTSGDLDLGADCNVGHFYIGKYYHCDGTAEEGNANGSQKRFRDKFANTDVTGFTLETDDVIKLTWTITVG